jgi:hypothetical protein
VKINQALDLQSGIVPVLAVVPPQAGTVPRQTSIRPTIRAMQPVAALRFLDLIKAFMGYPLIPYAEDTAELLSALSHPLIFRNLWFSVGAHTGFYGFRQTQFQGFELAQSALMRIGCCPEVYPKGVSPIVSVRQTMQVAIDRDDHDLIVSVCNSDPDFCGRCSLRVFQRNESGAHETVTFDVPFTAPRGVPIARVTDGMLNRTVIALMG